MIYDSIISIIDNTIDDLQNYSLELKEDQSLVTTVDLSIEKQLIEFFKKLSPSILIIGEESYDGSLKWDFKNKDFLIVDPIDGTENFAFLNKLYGTVLSWRIAGVEGNLIYIPSEKLIINDNSNYKLSGKKSTIDLFSSKCVNTRKINIPERARVLGSSSYMFSLLLTGAAQSYTYCNGAKIWDCYTGLSLARKFGLIIDNIPFDYFDYPNHIQKFNVYHETKK